MDKDLLAQFLSSKVGRLQLDISYTTHPPLQSNFRTDKYSIDQSTELIHTIVSYIRREVPKEFILSIKISAADYRTAASSAQVSLSKDESRALEHILAMAQWGGVDIIEISGGDYEKPGKSNVKLIQLVTDTNYPSDFLQSKNVSSKSPRQAYFARFSHQALKALESLPQTPTSPPPPLILLTGGLQTPRILRTALNSGHAHLLGIGRGSILCPNLPSMLKDKKDLSWDNIPFQREPDLSLPHIFGTWPLSRVWNLVPKIRLIGAGVGMAWYVVAMRRISHASRSGGDVRPNYNIGGLEAVFWMWAWIPVRGRLGRVWFGYFHIFSFLVIIAILGIYSFLS